MINSPKKKTKKKVRKNSCNLSFIEEQRLKGIITDLNHYDTIGSIDDVAVYKLLIHVRDIASIILKSSK